MRKVLLIMIFLTMLSLLAPGITKRDENVFSAPLTGISQGYPTITEEPTEETIPDNTPVPLEPIPTPTQTPIAEKNPYEFQSGEQKADISNGHLEIIFNTGFFEGEEKTSKISVEIVSEANLGEYSNLSEAFKVGLGNGISWVDKYGNVYIRIHSGYFNSNPLEAEDLRHSIEEWGRKNEDEAKKILEQLIGSEGIADFDMKISLEVEVLGGVRLKDDQKEDLYQNPTEVVDIVTKKVDGQYLATGTPYLFEKLKIEEGRKIIIDFCGWGPKGEPTYYSYILAIEVIEKEYANTPEVLLNQHLGCFFFTFNKD